MWTDTHCHLDAPEFEGDRPEVIARARAAGVTMLVVPAVMPSLFDAARMAAEDAGGAYALGTHPLYLRTAGDDPVARLAEALTRHAHDPRLVAVGEIGIDHFVPDLQDEVSRRQQEALYAAQLAVAAEHGLPVILHVRRSADSLLKYLRQQRSGGRPVPGGIAHAFNGSLQQAHAFLDLGFCLGFGGAMTFDRAHQIRRLAAALPEDAIVLETDAPDIPPHWLYRTAAERAAGARSRNEPAELPAIAAVLASLRGWSIEQTQWHTSRNARRVLPRLLHIAAPA